MEVPHIRVFVEENSIIKGAEEILSVLRPDWNTSMTRFKVFTDGITNKLIGCFNSEYDGDVVLIRVFGNNTDLLIDRQKEMENIKILNSAGLAPALYGTFDNGLVYEYVPGDILTVETCRLQNISELVAKKLADMHSVKTDHLEAEPALWPVITKFLSHIPEKFSDSEKVKRFNNLFPVKPDLQKEKLFLERELQALNNPIVLCHNDLLLANILYNADMNSITFIDFDYAAYNYQAYDIANHFNEFAGVKNADYSLFPDESFQKEWLRTYLERYQMLTEGRDRVKVTKENIESLYLMVQKFTLASHFFWGIWSFLQVEHSNIDFDFLNYAFVRFREYFNKKKQIFSC